MRFTKKLLATLLPITAASALAPVLSSCGGNSYVISYGDKVDCLNENAKDYHKINDVKNSVKNKAPVESRTTLTDESQLIQWDGGLIYQQMFYYDLIASHAVFDDETKQIKFCLIWAVESNKLSLTLDLHEGNKITGPSTIKYVKGSGDDAKKIFIQIHSEGSADYTIRSYCYQNTTIED